MTVVITGAFSYTGKYATRLLLSRGHKIRTLTYHPGRANPFGDDVQAFPYEPGGRTRGTDEPGGRNPGDRRDVF
jgi:nucleoside-diphosphate-sugar epimerase